MTSLYRYRSFLPHVNQEEVGEFCTKQWNSKGSENLEHLLFTISTIDADSEIQSTVTETTQL